jgi:hypothetical protein
MKKNFMRNAAGTMVDIAIGGMVMKSVGDSSMPQGFKVLTNIGISAGIAGRAIKRYRGNKW